MSVLIWVMIAALVVNTSVIVMRDNRTEAQLVALRAQLSELPALRSTVAAALSNTAACSAELEKLRQQQTSTGNDVTAQRMAVQALVVKLTEKKAERERAVPPPSSSGVRPAKPQGVHHVETGAKRTSCGEQTADISPGFSSRFGPLGWTSEREKVTCESCLSAIAIDNGETTVMSRRAS